MITEDFVSFKVAKLLEERGFDEECQMAWCYAPNKMNSEYLLRHLDCKNSTLKEYNSSDTDYAIAAPTLQMTSKWLRVVHKIDLCVLPCHYDYCLHGYECKIYKNKELICSLIEFKAPEEAMNAALLLVLNKDNNII